MNSLRLGLIALMAMALTWTAEALLRGAGVVPVVLAQADGGEDESAAAGEDEDLLSDEEIEREMERIERAIAGAEDEDEEKLKEFEPRDPLPADLAFDLPSDI